MFKIHFLNVGDGDCTIVELPDNEIMIVDLCNARSNLYDANPKFENPIEYLRRIYFSSSIFRYVQTHPEMDHMDGIADLSNKFTFTNFWDTSNTRQKPPSFSAQFREKDWDKYQELRRSNSAKYRLRSRTSIGVNGGSFPYSIYVISPSEQLVEKANSEENWNLLSYVILVEYEGFKLLLGGDASDTAWEDIYEYAKNDEIARKLLRNVTIFKASHHGRNSSYCGIEMLNLMNPSTIVISKGSVPGEESAYGKYYNWAGGADNMYLTSQGTIVADYYDIPNKMYSVNQKKMRVKKVG